MWIETTKDSCELTGYYKSGVKSKTTYPLYGSHDIHGHTLGWVVSYQKHNSTCAWSGQVFLDCHGRVCIHTTWLLTSQTDESHIWLSTNIGTDLFTPVTKEGDSVEVSACPKVCNIPAHVLAKEKI